MKRRFCHSVVGIILSIVGVVLPLGLLFGAYPRITHDRVKVTDEEITLVLLCSFLFLILELIALIYGLAVRRTVLGKAAVGLSAILLALSTLVFAYVLTLRLDRREAGWLKGTPFWVIFMGVLLVVASIVLFAFFRVQRLTVDEGRARGQGQQSS
jgi:hypothetical protein